MDAAINLGGAGLRITTPPTQAMAVWFDFGTVDISAWTWVGAVFRSRTTPAVAEALTFDSPDANTLVASLSAVQVAALAAVSTVWHYEISRTDPDPRQMFLGALILSDEGC